jgi:hypothetical protein
MKALLLLNGHEGCQTGIEDGFSNLLKTGVLDEVVWIYYATLISGSSGASGWSNIYKTARNYQPDLIVIFHIGRLPIDRNLLIALKNLHSKPILVYDEHDMYGSFAKPITGSMKTIMRHADVVSICGLGRFRDQIEKYNTNIIYTPHHADIARFDNEPYVLEKRERRLTFVGNRIGRRFKSLPGARMRAKFIESMGKAFPDDLNVYGHGWDACIGNRGTVDFYSQISVFKDSWITLSYEHYPEVPYYFSNRLPIALLAGSIYVHHNHDGYNNIFPSADFIFSYETTSQATDIIRYLMSLSNESMLEKSWNARNFSLKTFHPNVVWGTFLENILKIVNISNGQ